MRFIMTFLMMVAVARLQAQPQAIVVTGHVTDAEGQPLAGANIGVKSSDATTLTDAKGYFSIGVLVPAILIVSHTGYLPETVTVNGKVKVFTIFLHTNEKVLEEVMVSTGYQQLSKQKATGSFENVGQALLNREVSTDVISRLEGLTAGLYFSKLKANTELFVRGLSTINYNTQPLIVLDNFPYEGDLDMINPNDVESISILKDAAAAAIWGARAGNGVIVITTKKGSYNRVAQLSFNSSVTIQRPPDLYSSPDFLPANDFIDVEQMLFDKGFYNSTLTRFNKPVVSPVVEILDRQRRGLLTGAEASAQIDALRSYDIRDDYAKYLYQKSVRQQYALGFSGGGSDFNYLLNFGFDHNRGSNTGDAIQRKTLSTVMNFKPMRQLEISAAVNIGLNTSENNGRDKVTIGVLNVYPYARLADEDGQPLALEQGFRKSYLDTAGGGQLLDWAYRPLEELSLTKNSNELQHIMGRLSADYAFSKSFHADFRYQMDRDNGENKNYIPVSSYFARSLINIFSERNGNTIIQNIPYGGILDKTYNQLTAWGIRGQLNFQSHWKGNHRLAAIGGGEARAIHRQSQSTRLYGYDDASTGYANVNYLASYTLFNGLGVGNIYDAASLTDESNRYISAYANGQYTYRERYIASVSFRRDASNIFGVKANQRWVPLWSGGLSWIASKERFYHADWLPLLQFKVSYGYSGNVTPLNALPTIRYFSQPSSTTNLIFATIANAPNPNLRWEKAGMFNGGVTFALKDDRIKGSIEFYHKNSIDLLAPAPVDPTTGNTVMIMNSASLEGHGVDARISAVIMKKPFSWVSEVFFNYVTNKVTEYLLPNTNLRSYVNDGFNIVPAVGRDPYALISYRWGGLDPATGDPLGYVKGAVSKDYTTIVTKPEWEDLVIEGTRRPPYFGSWMNTLNWKRFSISANIIYKFGYKFRRSTLDYTALYNYWNGHAEFSRRWQQPGDEKYTEVPSMVYPINGNRDQFYAKSSVSVEDGGLIRLKDIQCQYELSHIGMGKVVIKNMKVYGYINNIGLLWRANQRGLDPDYNFGLPEAMSVSIGIKASF